MRNTPLSGLLVLALTAAVNADEPLAPYTETIPGTDLQFDMLPVPGGVVRLPVGADSDEPAFVEVELPPYWIGKHEVTWGEFRQYMALDRAYAEMQQLSAAGAKRTLVSKAALSGVLDAARTADGDDLGVDAVTAPTPLYDPSTTYESGEEPELPAVTMTPFAAQQYTKWLSAVTGHSYRLPSEAEWLHAAGEPGDLESAAWYTDNSEWVAHPVGQKTPNALGLFDTLGNAAELVLDAHRPGGRPELAGKRVGWSEGVAWPGDGDARLAKGGWYDAEAAEVTTDARMVTDPEEWCSSDPNLPRSPWWFADYPATGVGFRIVRPMTPIEGGLAKRVWDTADPSVARAVTERLREGRGKVGPIGDSLPEALNELAEPDVRALLK